MLLYFNRFGKQLILQCWLGGTRVVLTGSSEIELTLNVLKIFLRRQAHKNVGAHLLVL